MNVNLIFLFTICVLLPNGLYSNSTMPSVEQWLDNNLVAEKTRKMFFLYCWTKNGTMDTPFLTDNYGNIFMKILAKPSSIKQELYVTSLDRIGVYIAASPTEGSFNEDLINYLTNLLGIPINAMEIVDGLTDEMKRIRITKGFIKSIDVIERICQKLSEKQN